MKQIRRQIPKQGGNQPGGHLRGLFRSLKKQGESLADSTVTQAASIR
jgi:hypothetical protein